MLNWYGTGIKRSSGGAKRCSRSLSCAAPGEAALNNTATKFQSMARSSASNANASIVSVGTSRVNVGNCVVRLLVDTKYDRQGVWNGCDADRYAAASSYPTIPTTRGGGC